MQTHKNVLKAIKMKWDYAITGDEDTKPKRLVFAKHELLNGRINCYELMLQYTNQASYQ